MVLGDQELNEVIHRAGQYSDMTLQPLLDFITSLGGGVDHRFGTQLGRVERAYHCIQRETALCYSIGYSAYDKELEMSAHISAALQTEVQLLYIRALLVSEIF